MRDEPATPTCATRMASRADDGVVADLDQVVDLGPAADDRLPEGGPVDGGIGADLDVVLDDDPTDLGDLPVRPAVEDVAEAIGAEHRARVHDHPLAQDHVLPQHHVRMEHAPLAHATAVSDVGMGADHGARLHHDVRADHREGLDAGLRRDARARGHPGRRIDPGHGRRRRVEEPQEGRHGQVSLGDADDGPVRGQRHVGADDEGRGGAPARLYRLAGRGHEGQVPWLRPVEALEAAHSNLGVAFQDSPDEPGQLVERALHYFFSFAFS